jgi:hypothetical protein
MNTFGTIITGGVRINFYNNRQLSECQNKLPEEDYWKDFHRSKQKLNLGFFQLWVSGTAVTWDSSVGAPRQRSPPCTSAFKQSH